MYTYNAIRKNCPQFFNIRKLSWTKNIARNYRAKNNIFLVQSMAYILTTQNFFSLYYSYVNAKVIPVFHCIIKRRTTRFQVSSKEYWWHMRTRLSCMHMIRLHAHPLHPSPVSELSLFLSLPVCRLSRYCRERGGKGGRGAKSYDREENLLLDK